MNLKHDIHNSPITYLDLSFYVEVEKGMKVADVIEKMQASHRKCALVMDRGEMIGIFTERDILKKTIGKPESLKKPVEALMALNPETIAGDITIDEAIQMITEKPYRYLPVLNKNNKIIGTLTHYSIIKFISDYFPEEIYNLPPDLDQIATARSGA